MYPLLEQLLCLDPAARSTAAAVLAHPLLVGSREMETPDGQVHDDSAADSQPVKLTPLAWEKPTPAHARNHTLEAIAAGYDSAGLECRDLVEHELDGFLRPGFLRAGATFELPACYSPPTKCFHPEECRFNQDLLLSAVHSVDMYNNKRPVEVYQIRNFDNNDEREGHYERKKMLREIEVLGAVRHPNLIGLTDVYKGLGTDGWYLVVSTMATDLHRLIRSKQQLTIQHIQYFTLQLARGLHALHRQGLVHLDLKPGNIMVNEDCSLSVHVGASVRSIELGLEAEEEVYVINRWYRAPEVICNESFSSETLVKIDMWHTTWAGTHNRLCRTFLFILC